MVGKVTPISSVFSAEEAQKASERVQEKITERRQQLDVLKGFISDNAELINIVQTLPNELQHQIMVPFGNAAFFPGRLIHTNEFMVLLGDGYYAERTSKQTAEILKRRHKALESHIESVRAECQDLKAEASFFDATADEAASGLVQIVEDYTEETFQKASSKVELPSSSEAEQGKSGNNDDDDYERIFAELEAEEAAAMEAEEAAGSGEESVESGNDFDDRSNEFSTGDVVRPVKANSLRQPPLVQEEIPPLVQDVASETKAGSSAPSKFNTSKNALEFPESKRSVQDPPVAKQELPQRQQNMQAPAVAKHEVSVPPLQQNTTGSKAPLIGSIVERAHNLDTKRREDTVAVSSKPVSRFRMNRK